MTKVAVIGWKPGLNKIELTKTLQRDLSLSLRSAKSLTDQILEGERVEIEVDDSGIESDVVGELRRLGFVVILERSNQLLEP